MAAAPLVSIIVPAHDAAPFIDRALGSARSQTMADIEILVVDDASRDDTWQRVTQAAAADPRIIPLRHHERRGPGAARNTALARARGDWVALLDADDAYEPGRLARLLETAEARGADMLADNLQMLDFDSGAPLGTAWGPKLMSTPEPLSPAELVRRDMPDMIGRAQFGFVKPLMRRRLLGDGGVRYREELLSGEDFVLYVECVLRGARFHLTADADYRYYVRTASVSAPRSAQLHICAGNLHLMRLARAADRELRAVLRARQRKLDWICFRYRLEHGDVTGALGHAARLPKHELLGRLAAAAGRRIGRRTLAFNLPDRTP